MPGKWDAVADQPFYPATLLLLTDGSVMCQDGGTLHRWSRLFPDQSGDYVAGLWRPVPPMAERRRGFASAVLADGRLFVAGGSGSPNNDTFADRHTEPLPSAEIYDPRRNTWSSLTVPSGWPPFGNTPCSVLTDGRVLIGFDGRAETATYDPARGSWAMGASREQFADEVTWVILRDHSVLSNRGERYLPERDAWIADEAGPFPGPLPNPMLLLPDGRVWATGPTGDTALYVPGTSAGVAGRWEPGPSFPAESPLVPGTRISDLSEPGRSVVDKPLCLLPSGRVLCAAHYIQDAAGGGVRVYSSIAMFEFDPSAMTLEPVDSPENVFGPAFYDRALLLPSGQALLSRATGGADIRLAIYTPDPEPAPSADWRPAITEHPPGINRLGTVTIKGKLMNGLSEAVTQVDATAATNYPLVKLRHRATGEVLYCQTFGHLMSIAERSELRETRFVVPGTAQIGESELCLIVNGISSECVPLTVEPPVLEPPQLLWWSWAIGNFADGALIVFTPYGPMPVGPWDPATKKQVDAIYSRLADTLRELEALADEVPDHLQTTDKADVPPQDF